MNNTNNKYGFADKWSPAVEQYNFTQVPNLLLACQGHLELKDGELLTLIHLLTFWFSSKSKVFPSIRRLSKFSGIAYSTTQRRLKLLEDKGFIERIHRYGTTNTFNLEPCIQKLALHQEECTNPPRKKSEYYFETSEAPSSSTSNKEDEHITIRTSKTENNLADSLSAGKTVEIVPWW